MQWAVPEYERLVTMYLKAAMQDGYLPMTEKPNPLEELDMLTQQRPMRQAILAQPPDPRFEAIRSQAQLQEQRYEDLRLKEAEYGNQAPG